MAAYVGHIARQRELVKLYNKLCHKYSRYEVWQDMVVMIACSIANAVDKRHFDEREAMYMRVVQKYDKDELDIFPEFFTHIVMGMEEHPDCDFLGELYMDLELGNKRSGQFFTPYCVCQAMASMAIDDDALREQLERTGWISVADCACGAGAMLVAAANYLRSIGVNYQLQALFAAQDVDAMVALMCYIQLSLMGCAGYVVIGNSLTEPMTGNVLFGEESSRCWYTPMYFHAVWDARRAIAMTKSIFQRVATVVPAEAAEQPTANMPETESAGNAQEEPTSALAPEAQEDYTPTFTISTCKKNAGQIMFDFG